MKLTAGVVIGGRYRLESLLARGGMGSVWIAHHEQLDSRVAVKFMDRELASSSDARQRFEREARAAAKLRSPHVVQVLDYGVEADTPFIVMELLAGQDLRSRLKERGRLTLQEASVILTQACKALRLASDAGIIHRDLKPGNIFIARSGDDEVVKILDFGVAKATRAALGEGTTSGMLLGSPHYMSPEQARGTDLDHRADLFSMAVIAFQMITGERPFPGRDIGDVIVKICSEALPMPSDKAPELPPEIDRYFVRALARDPAERFQSPHAMATEFAAIVARHLGLPAPDSTSHSGRVRMPPLPPLGLEAGPTDATPGAGTPSPDSVPSASLRVDGQPRAGTLTLATKSVPYAPRGKRRLAPWLALGAALLVGVGLYVVVAGTGGAAGQSAAPAGSVEDPGALDARAAPSSEPPASAVEPAPTGTARVAAEPSSTADPTATATASAVAAPLRTPPGPAVRPPPPSATKTKKEYHPVLGF